MGPLGHGYFQSGTVARRWEIRSAGWPAVSVRSGNPTVLREKARVFGAAHRDRIAGMEFRGVAMSARLIWAPANSRHVQRTKELLHAVA
ncbi:hypothetical protein O1611_g9979 [Lasiodiplodia mahajangana]|uniref:Uncharacterized protein n=1 Tax=Lasiodiplodia mahajangana TaxID=1108764 RepID=A0ACC2J3D6_9PEZI|nr:hypothetical protein O1611_g9979 [Lasiodiplodia mahajangana]